MDVKAIILVGGQALPSQQLAGIPIPFLDVLGEPVVQRVLSRLEHFGVSATAVVTEVPVSRAPVARGSFPSGLHWADAVGQQFWRTAENLFNDFASSGTELVLVVRLGAYAEIDYEEVVQFHLDKQCRITSVSGPGGTPLDTFVISASRRNDAAYLFRHELRDMRTACEEFQHRGYTNPLQNAGDLRFLALDGFAGLTTITPRGSEIKPGIWVGENTEVHRNARVLAPCFIGSHAKVRASSLLTRGSVIEHHTEVDCGTVIENSTILPMTIVGAGLDVTHSVLGFSRIWNLKRNVEVQIGDHRLISAVRSAPRGVFASAARLTHFLPKVLSQAAFNRRLKPQPDHTEAVRRPTAAFRTTETVGEDPLATASNLMSVRRYGNE